MLLLLSGNINIGCFASDLISLVTKLQDSASKGY